MFPKIIIYTQIVNTAGIFFNSGRVTNTTERCSFHHLKIRSYAVKIKFGRHLLKIRGTVTISIKYVSKILLLLRFFIFSFLINRMTMLTNSTAYYLCRHGIFQLLSGWADGPAYATQCPILPKNSYTYRFNITGQEGTLWWHAHSGWLRATVHGALIIRPRKGYSYPFKKPSIEVPIILGTYDEALLFIPSQNSIKLNSDN